MAPFRWEPSPEERLLYSQRLLDVRREFDVGLDRDARHDPAHWGTLPICSMCGRPLIAQETCGACGDETDVERAGGGARETSGTPGIRQDGVAIPARSLSAREDEAA